MDLSILNAEQRKAVTAPLGPVCVIAGPGSGKTRVLTHRIAYMIEALGVNPRSILAVTFTNKAAGEMRSRLERIIGDKAKEVSLGTFHSIFARILRYEADKIEYKSNFSILDEHDQEKIVKAILGRRNLDPKQYPAARFQNAISRLKNDLTTPTEASRMAGSYPEVLAAEIYTDYQEILGNTNKMDFDDLIVRSVQLFSENPNILGKYRRIYQHLLVDEFQDSDTGQYRLIQDLGLSHKDVFIVGYEDQSIYGWRGADFRHMKQFTKAFGATTIVLERNYRSTQIILDVAMDIINEQEDRYEKNLNTDRKTGQKVVMDRREMNTKKQRLFAQRSSGFPAGLEEK
jgi:DNA helicase-2/ATP-dependent DNA helicase PcrA